MLKYRESLDTFTRPQLGPHSREGWVCLDKNEAPFDPLQRIPGFAERIASLSARCYPDPFPLYGKLAALLGVPPEWLLITFGSEQALRFAFEAMVTPGDGVVCLDPTFAMLDVYRRQFESNDQLVVFDSRLQVSAEDVSAAITTTTRLVVLPNPNNPTGSLLSLADLRCILKKTEEVRALLVVDEAYGAYTDVTALPLVRESANIVVTQTFSKGWGLAGVRVGYLIAQPGTVELFRKLKPIDEVSTFSLAACLLALEHPECLRVNVEQVRKWQAHFRDLHSANVQNVNAHGNFLLFRVAEDRRACVSAWFRDHRILVKDRFEHPALGGLIRFSVGCDEIMCAIDAFLHENA